MTLKAAVVCSTLVHLGLLTVCLPKGLMPRRALHALEVSYLPAPSENVVPVQPAPGRPAWTPPAEPAAESRPLQVTPAPAGNLPVRAPVRPVVLDTPRLTPPVSSAAVVLPDLEFSALQHKEQIRKHLKARLHYPELSIEGTVRLRLVLTAVGSLQAAEVLEASDPRLIQLALRDAQWAAPYPRFLPAMRRRTASYEFLVRYQPE